MAGTTLTPPRIAVTGLDEDVGRSGAEPALDLDALIDSIEHGPRLAWTIAADCPCAPLHARSERADPTCERCDGYGKMYFGPEHYEPPADVGALTDLQKLILELSGGGVIKGVFARAGRRDDLYDELGKWAHGTKVISVRAENLLGFRDRLVDFDAEMPYSEVIALTHAELPVRLRYRATTVTAVHSEVARFRLGLDFDLKAGRVVWRPNRAPATNTRLSYHYRMHPTWVVESYPHVNRAYTTTSRVERIEGQIGAPMALPLQALVQLEHLPPPGAAREEA